MSTANKSQRAASFVFLMLLAAAIAGPVLYLLYSGRDRTAVPLLVGCVVTAFVLALLAAHITARHRRSRRNAMQYGMRESGPLHLLQLRQWLILLVGVAVVAVGTGAFTGVRVLAGEPSEAAPTAAPTPTGTPLVETVEPTVSETTEPSETIEPSETTDPSEPAEAVEPTDTSGTDEGDFPTPAPGSTEYLDSADPTDGGYDAKPVSLSGNRYSRGIQFYCDTPTNSHMQWNVAGNVSFSATAGIDDSTEDAFGKIVEILFYDQDGHRLLSKPAEVSVGHPAKLSLKLTGVVGLRMTCSSRDAKTNEQNDTYAVFGDPIVVHQ
ncbi:NPCBM/NEW2 domain-containing protein [Couchioplanes caeruleus]|uniref:NPCBM/NEW2 domain-containing protein n=1 Tax=Couchioplanes caeruleus TaxID=56438 RepID=UPI0020BD56D5|nr:NPCBM/NEW2 domain-containing protein [Couchioplanes caeruleus]UQU62694.1 NPCBM/NEW2 domain-containing protein [Couchioplanes caeruleus]